MVQPAKFGFAGDVRGFGEGDSNRGLRRPCCMPRARAMYASWDPTAWARMRLQRASRCTSGVDPRVGHVSVVAQSGGLSSDVLRRVPSGITFRGLVTVGNSADVGPASRCQPCWQTNRTVIGFCRGCVGVILV